MGENKRTYGRIDNNNPTYGNMLHTHVHLRRSDSLCERKTLAAHLCSKLI